MNTNRLQILAGMLIVAMVLIVGVVLFKSAHAKQIVTFDVQAVINAFIVEQNSKNLSETELNQQVDKFTIKLSEIVTKESAKNNYVVLPKQAVMAGGIDITNDIKYKVLGA
ncbi:MAG: TrbI F-type domain-containing protein [Rickettsiaceae bacterium]|nr:TrbI F-type domain-containing protein [Rickettsiaceae bacterium]